MPLRVLRTQKQNKKVGLYLGKFAPLHLGHESVIRQMVAETDSSFVFVYNYEGYPVSEETRMNIIKQLYPMVGARVLKNSPQEVGYTDEIKQKQEDYLAERLQWFGLQNKITHLYGSEPYLDHIAKRFGWTPVYVDVSRTDVNISATQCREQPKKYQKYIHPFFQEYLPKRITVLGGESTGKTTLCEDIYTNYACDSIPEYGAVYWEEHQHEGKLSLAQLEYIMNTHKAIRLETIGQTQHPFVIEDTCLLTTYLFGKEYGEYDKIPQKVIDDLKETDLFLLCDTDIPFDPSGGRISDEKRHQFNAQYKAILESYGLPYVLVSGDRETRLQAFEDAYNDYL